MGSGCQKPCPARILFKCNTLQESHWFAFQDLIKNTSQYGVEKCKKIFQENFTKLAYFHLKIGSEALTSLQTCSLTAMKLTLKMPLLHLFYQISYAINFCIWELSVHLSTAHGNHTGWTQELFCKKQVTGFMHWCHLSSQKNFYPWPRKRCNCN